MFRAWVFFTIKPSHLFEHYQQLFICENLWCLKATCINDQLTAALVKEQSL
jgi:hypothetical protein